MADVGQSATGATSVAQQASETATAAMRALAAHDDRDEICG